MVTDGTNTAIDNKYNFACNLYIDIFTFDIGPLNQDEDHPHFVYEYLANGDRYG